jgi:hypothetical protein
MLVPIFARLHAVAAADAFRRVEQNAPRLAVPEPGRGDEVAISLFQNFNWICGHAASFPKSRLLTANLYHFPFAPVNLFCFVDTKVGRLFRRTKTIPYFYSGQEVLSCVRQFTQVVYGNVTPSDGN